MTKEPLSPYKMNLPTALKERIEEAAHANRRSISAEIISALEEAYPPQTFDMEALSRLIQLLSDTDPAEHERYLEKVNASLRNQGLEMVDQNREIIIRRIAPTETPSPTKETRSTRDGKRRLKLPKKAGD